MDAPRSPKVRKPKKEVKPRSGFYVAPGEYEIKISYDGQSDMSSVKIVKDPRKNVDDTKIREKQTLIDRQNTLTKRATLAVDQVRDIQSNLSLIKELLNTHDTPKEDSIYSSLKNVNAEIKGLLEQALGKKVQGIYRKPEVLTSMLRSSSYLLDHILSPATKNQRNQLTLLEQSIEEYEGDLDTFRNKHLRPFYNELKGYNLSIIPD